jgi:hypothetical protein
MSEAVARVQLVMSGLVAVVVLGATATVAGQAQAATEPTLYWSEIAHAVLSKQYGYFWSFIEPGYRSAVKRAHWQQCVGALVKASHGLKVKSIVVAGARAMQSMLPRLGRVALVDVSLQVLYQRPPSKMLRAGLSYAY